MTPTDIRKKLHGFIADANDSTVNDMYLMLKAQIEKTDEFKLSTRHREILMEEREAHLQGLTKSYTSKEAREFITGIAKP